MNILLGIIALFGSLFVLVLVSIVFDIFKEGDCGERR